jgi:Ca2+-transporting ATPase
LSLRQLSLSIIQGIIITAGCLGIGYYYMQTGSNDITVRTVVFITLLFSNIFLTLVNRSFRYTMLTTLLYKNMLVPLIIGLTLLFIAALLYLPFASDLFGLVILDAPNFILCVITAAISTCWIEIWKLLHQGQYKKVGSGNK